jgi:hypothetical protein
VVQKERGWSPKQRAFYAHLLELECRAIDSILNQDSGSHPGSRA